MRIHEQGMFKKFPEELTLVPGIYRDSNKHYSPLCDGKFSLDVQTHAPLFPCAGAEQISGGPVQFQDGSRSPIPRRSPNGLGRHSKPRLRVIEECRHDWLQ
jgi:hypothetical protein